MQQWSKKLQYDPFATPDAAAAPAAAAQQPLEASPDVRRVPPAVAAAEAAWDAVAARSLEDAEFEDALRSSSSSSASNGQASNGSNGKAGASSTGAKVKAGFHVHVVNGASHAAAGAGLAAAAAQEPPAAAAAAPPAAEQQPQQHWQQLEAQQYVFEQVTGQHQQSQQAPQPVQAEAGRKQGAELRGVHGVSVWPRVLPGCASATLLRVRASACCRVARAAAHSLVCAPRVTWKRRWTRWWQHKSGATARRTRSMSSDVVSSDVAAAVKTHARDCQIGVGASIGSAAISALHAAGALPASQGLLSSTSVPTPTAAGCNSRQAQADCVKLVDDPV